MVPETPNKRPMPQRHEQQDVFICDMADAIRKDVIRHLEHPYYLLSKRPVTKVHEYEHAAHRLRITPSVAGLASIYD